MKNFAVLRKIREAEEAQRAFERLTPEERKRIEEERETEAKRLEEEKRKRHEEIIARRQARKEETNKRHQEDIKILKSYIKSGMTMKKVAELMNSSIAYVYGLKKESIQNGTWLTYEELKELDEKRKKEQQRVKSKRKRQKQKEKEKEKEEEKFRIKKEAWRLLKYREEGYTYKEIAKKMNYSISYLTNLKRKADEIFADEEVFDEFTQLMDKKAQKEEQARLDRERKEADQTIREQEKLIKAFDKERKRKIKEYTGTYKTYKKVAEKEDEFELAGKENVSIDGRRKFIETLAALHNLYSNISDKDIEFVINTFYMHPEIVDKNSIKFLISDANEKGGLQSVRNMLNKLTNALQGTKFYEPLVEYRRWTKKIAMRPNIQEMKEQGMNNTQIGEILGISSAEVNIIFYGDRKPDFSDFDDR